MIKDFLSSDKLGSTVFAPVKMDFVGNIKVGVVSVDESESLGMKTALSSGFCWVFWCFWVAATFRPVSAPCRKFTRNWCRTLGASPRSSPSCWTKSRTTSPWCATRPQRLCCGSDEASSSSRSSCRRSTRDNKTSREHWVCMMTRGHLRICLRER